MNIPLPKLKAIIRYFCAYTDARFLGKVKLMKLFYFLDFLHVKKYGTPVTYDRYVNLEHGPIPSSILNLVNEAISDPDRSILSDTIRCETPDHFNMNRIVSTRTFSEQDEDYFSPSELEVLRQVCQRFGDKNTKHIEDAAHNEAPWKETRQLDEIPYSLAALDRDCQRSKEEIEMSQKIVYDSNH